MTLLTAMASSALLWAALPPLDLWPLAWVAPVGWLLLVRSSELPGRRPYWSIWTAGFCFWMAALHWLRLPHWATSFGWLAASFYLAFYIAAFVWLSRVAVHRLGISVTLAAPVVWTGLELLRAHFLTGFTMASLGHTQYRWLELIQISDLTGAYGVSFLVMLAAACLARMLPTEGRPATAWPLAIMVVAIGAAMAYGHVRIGAAQTRSGPTIALVQGSIDTEIKSNPNEWQRVLKHYFRLSQDLVDGEEDVDLVVWPETMFPYPHIEMSDDVQPPSGVSWTLDDLKYTAGQHRLLIEDMVKAIGAPLLLGIDIHEHGPGIVRRYNSVLHLDRQARILGRYDKHHRVLFGEYVPFANYVPALYRLTPLTGGIEPGTTDQVFGVKDARLASSICFETVLPHVMRRQIRRLAARGEEPDVLVNLTNDGWFWGSSELDMHLICGVFRAVECRKPLLIAANTGISAWIDSDGRIVRRGPRRQTDVIIARPRLDSRRSWYVLYGDWASGFCLLACAVLSCLGAIGFYRERSAAAV